MMVIYKRLQMHFDVMINILLLGLILFIALVIMYYIQSHSVISVSSRMTSLTSELQSLHFIIKSMLFRIKC